MATKSTIAKTTTTTIAAALFALMAGSVSAAAQNPQPAGTYLQIAAQKIKVPTRGTGPTRPVAGAQKMTNTTPGSTANSGCHDGASQTSYEGGCDPHPEYYAGGCESGAEQASLPGNCPNSSEP